MAAVALPVDVVLLILEKNSVINAVKLHLDPTASLKAPRLACRLFYQLADRFFFRNFKMDGSAFSKLTVHRILDDTSNLRYNIWHLEVWMAKVDIRLLEQALDKLTQLKDLKLFAAVDQVLPVTLVEILENRSPRYRLHVANYCGRLAIEHESVHFLKTANLCSLQIRAPSNIKGSPAYMAELQSLKKVIMSASNLRVLDVHMLDVHAVFGGLLNSVNAIPPGIFQFEKGDRFPPLEELSLYCYSHCFSIENWAAWFACMDWTQLRRLNFGISYQASFMKYFKGKLPDLRSFKTGLHAVEEVEGLDGFLTALDQLEDLDIRSFIAKPLFSQLALARHGSCSLRHLSYLSPIIFDMSKPCRFISTDQLDELNKQCPKLESLEIDLRIDQGWPDSIMSSLARFACLHHLRVRFDMPATKGQLDLRKSTLIAKSLFAFTRQEKIGVPLLTMVSIVRLEGNHRDIQNECSRDQLRRILATIRCKVVQRDDGIESTIVKSWKGFIGRHSMR